MNRETLLVDKPWGSFSQFTLNEVSTVKILTVKAGARLSLQSHQYREELWGILDEGVSVQIDNEIKTPAQDEEIFIPQGAKHRLVGAADKTCRVLEVSFGEFDENDIERFEDDFGRV